MFKKFELFSKLKKGKFMLAFPKFVDSWNAFAKFWNGLDLTTGLSITKRGTKYVVRARYV